MKRYEGVGARTAWAIALLTPLAAAALMVPIRSEERTSNLALVMVGVVAISVAPGFRVAAVAAGVSAGVWFDFFLTAPYETFFIRRGNDVQTAVLMACVATMVGAIAARRRQAREKAQRAGAEVVGLYVTAQMLSAGAGPGAMIEEVERQMKALLFVTACRFERRRPAADEPIINRGGDLDWPGHRWSLQHHGWPSVPVSLPVDSGGRTSGCYVLNGPSVGGPLTLDRRLTALAMADLTGAALGGQETTPPALGGAAPG